MLRVKKVWPWNSDRGMVSEPLDHGNAASEGTTVLRERAELKIYGYDCETLTKGWCQKYGTTLEPSVKSPDCLGRE